MDKERSKVKEKSVKIRKSLFLIFSLLFLIFLLPSCSLPKIIVLDDPLTPEEHINLGVAYERKGEATNAVEEYKKAAKELPIAYLYLGNAYLQMNNFEEAEKYYKKSVKKAPDCADAYNNLAWLYYLRNEHLDDAEALASKARTLNPSREDYLDTLGKIKELKQKNGL